jgi:hypothetical protein
MGRSRPQKDVIGCFLPSSKTVKSSAGQSCHGTLLLVAHHHVDDDGGRRALNLGSAGCCAENLAAPRRMNIGQQDRDV